MPKFTTIFRAMVMVGVTIIVVEGWQQYGPSAAQLKSLAARALEIAHDALDRPDQSATPAAMPMEGAPTVASPFSAMPTAEAEPAGPAMTSDEIPSAPPIFAPAADWGTAPARPDRVVADESSDKRLKALLNRLEQMGAVEPRLAAWGSGGQLYRFCCRAALGSAPNVARHFESIAAEPLVAVEDVVAKVETWRAAEIDRGRVQ